MGVWTGRLLVLMGHRLPLQQKRIGAGGYGSGSSQDTHTRGRVLQSQEQRILGGGIGMKLESMHECGSAREASALCMCVCTYIQQQRSLAAHFCGCQPVSSDHTSPRIDDWAPTAAWKLTRGRGRPFTDEDRTKEQVFRTVLCCINQETPTKTSHVLHDAAGARAGAQRSRGEKRALLPDGRRGPDTIGRGVWCRVTGDDEAFRSVGTERLLIA